MNLNMVTKSMKKIILLESFSIISLQSHSQTQDSLSCGLGDFKYSILNSSQFAKANTGTWALANGGALDAKSGLHKLLDASGSSTLKNEKGFRQVPDARGVFIRGLNLNRDAETGDPEGSRTPGSYQPDSFKSHSHVSTRGRHRSGRDRDNRSLPSPRGGNRDAANQVKRTESSGGKETRPRNIGLFAFIKTGC